jgi:hypothetical protein
MPKRASSPNRGDPGKGTASLKERRDADQLYAEYEMNYRPVEQGVQHVLSLVKGPFHIQASIAGEARGRCAGGL